jgi:hypothetical protein
VSGPTPSEPARFAEVRRKLVERGYLQGPIERFLLRDLLASTSPARATAGACARAAALGAPVLGGVLAASAVAANRPLLGAGDALVLWAYLSCLAALALLAVNLVAASVVVALARRRGARSADAVRAAVLVALPLVAYLALVGFARGSGPRDALEWGFLAAEIALTVLLAWLGGLASVAAVAGQTGQVPVRARTAAGLLLLLAPLAGALLYASSTLGSGAPAEPSPFSPAAASGRVLFLAVDGLDGPLVEALEERGAVARLLEAMASGAVFPLRRAAGLEPPEVWTTILTGMPSSAHGVRGVGAEILPGVATPLRPEGGPLSLGWVMRSVLPSRTVPTSGAARSVRTLWEIVALRGPATSVGFWASWPARDDGGDGAGSGFVVSDRVLAKLLAGKEDDRDTAPAALFARLRAGFDGERAAIRREFEERIPTPRSDGARRLLWESFLIDAYALRTSATISRDPGLRAAFVYLPGLDILRIRLDRELSVQGTSGRLEEAEALAAYVRWLDEVLADALRNEAGGTTVVVADPGRSATASSEGFAVVAGPRAKRGCVSPAVGDLDVAPLVLSLLGYPRSDEMPGREPAACLEDVAGPSPIETYGRRRVAARARGSDSDPEMLERLRSLGYLE